LFFSSFLKESLRHIFKLLKIQGGSRDLFVGGESISQKNEPSVAMEMGVGDRL
jgi:hypothetical protein